MTSLRNDPDFPVPRLPASLIREGWWLVDDPPQVHPDPPDAAAGYACLSLPPKEHRSKMCRTVIPFSRD